MASPSSFDDPNDCKNPLRYDLLSEKEQYGMYYEARKKASPKSKPNEIHNWAIHQVKNSPLRTEEGAKKAQEESEKEFDERFGVLCLTANPTNHKMWESYGDNYKGFCVGFHSELLFPHLGGGGAVDYVNELPIIYPKPRHSYEQQHLLLVFKKLEKWSFEEEYRTHKFYPYPVKIEDRLIQIPAKAYCEIILGKNMDKKISEELIGSLPEELKHVKIIKQEDL